MTLILGHRGAPRATVENTAKAMRIALEQGADGAEFDVRLASCGTPVVCHDHTLERFTRRATRVRYTSAWALSQENLGDGEGVPTLETVLKILRGTTVNIEIKTDDGDPEALAFAVAVMVQSFRGQHRRVVVSSFDPSTLIHLREMDPTIERGLLIDPAHRELGSSLTQLRAVSPHAIHPHWSEGPEKIRFWRASGYDVNVWTCDQPEVIRAMVEAGATSVISNLPAEARTSFAT